MFELDRAFLSSHGPELVVQILAAILCGGLLGYERQRMAKPVGILTAVLVALGSTLFAMTAVVFDQHGHEGFDPSRIPSMIVSGIGFIGAGAILRSKFQVSGLASAATIWSIGGIGILIGWGHVLLAAMITAVIFMILRLIPMLEHAVFNRRFCLHLDVILAREHLGGLLAVFEQNQVGPPAEVVLKGDRAIVRVDECGIGHKWEVMGALNRVDGVVEIIDRSGREPGGTASPDGRRPT